MHGLIIFMFLLLYHCISHHNIFTDLQHSSCWLPLLSKIVLMIHLLLKYTELLFQKHSTCKNHLRCLIINRYLTKSRCLMSRLCSESSSIMRSHDDLILCFLYWNILLWKLKCTVDNTETNIPPLKVNATKEKQTVHY